MAALAMLQVYGSDCSEDEINGFEVDSGSIECPSSRETGKVDDRSLNEQMKKSDDSDGSFFGEPRKKKTKKEIQRQESQKRRRSAHTVITNDCHCRRKCADLLSHDDREKVNQLFWSTDELGQRSFIQQYVSLGSVEHRRKFPVPAEGFKKKRSYICKLPSANDVSVVVCRTFFLNTIGFGENCGNIIYRCIDGCDDPEIYCTKCGKYTRNKDLREAVKAHILTFGPSISHYRREHAPNRLYLPSDITQTAMHMQYLATHDLKVSYPLYSRVLNDMNVSIVKLGHEECEVCVATQEHQKTSRHENGESDCVVCSRQIQHMEYSEQARKEYRADGDIAIVDQLVMSVDLQKVIQLPRLDGLKSIVFSQRLLAYNETFAPVGAYTRAFPVVACLWSEQITGRGSNDILSCFHRIILHFGHLKKLTLWLDNCSAQNKHWNLFQHIVLLLNKMDVVLQHIELKYFEPGHSFMSADSFHAAVETSMRHDRVITFDDFKAAVAKATKKVEVLDMETTDFFQTELGVTQYTLNHIHPRPYIDNIRKIVFQKGRYEVGYADTVNAKQLVYCKLFSKKQQKLISSDGFLLYEHLSWQKAPRGIDQERKKTLLSTLHDVIPENKKLFFESLPIKKYTK